MKLDPKTAFFPEAVQEICVDPVLSFVVAHQEGLWHAARLPGGYESARFVDRCVELLLQKQCATPQTAARLRQILSVLSLDKIDDPNLPYMGYFALIDPSDPVVEDLPANGWIASRTLAHGGRRRPLTHRLGVAMRRHRRLVPPAVLDRTRFSPGLEAGPSCEETTMTKTLYCNGAMIAALNAQDFLRRHGNSLSEVLNVIAGDRGLALYCEVRGLLDGLSPDLREVGKALRNMRDLLAEADAPEDQHAASLRWHGARLSDLAAALPR